MAITKIQSNAFPSSIDLSSVDITIGSGEITTANIADSNVTTAKIADANVTHAKLHTDMDLSGKTVTLPDLTKTLNIHRIEANSIPRLQLKRTGNNAGNGYIECLGADDSIDYKIAFAEAAGLMTFEVAGVDAMNINSSGNVGINTSNPTAKLQVDGGSGLSSLTIQNPALMVGTYGSQNVSFDVNEIQSRDNGSATTLLLQKNGGNLGIGSNTTPSYKLDVTGNGRFTSKVRFENYIEFAGSISTPQTAAAIYRPADNQLAFSTSNTERMRINNTGEVIVNNSSTSTGHLRVKAANNDYAFWVDTSGSSITMGTSDKSLYNTSSSTGINYRTAGEITVAKNSSSSADPLLLLNNVGTMGQMIRFLDSGTQVGTIDASSSGVTYNTGGYLSMNPVNGITSSSSTNKIIDTYQLGLWGSNGNYVNHDGSYYYAQDLDINETGLFMVYASANPNRCGSGEYRITSTFLVRLWNAWNGTYAPFMTIQAEWGDTSSFDLVIYDSTTNAEYAANPPNDGRGSTFWGNGRYNLRLKCSNSLHNCTGTPAPHVITHQRVHGL